MGTIFKVGQIKNLLLNIYSSCFHKDSFYELKSCDAELFCIRSFGTFDDIIIIKRGDFTYDPNKGRVYNEFVHFIDLY